MINFFVDRVGRIGIRDYLNHRGRSLADRFNVFEYERLGALQQLLMGPTIFAALDQTSPAANAAASAIFDAVRSAEPAVPVLNDPRKVQRRYELLTRLFEAGCNRFKVIRAPDDPTALRYPVFIRWEHRHSGSLTPLLHDRRALDGALVEFVLRGVRLETLLIVEFCDTNAGDGLYRKYSAMRIGDVIVPRHLHVSSDWIVKSSSDLRTESLILEERKYLEGHQHEPWLRQVFDLAQIDYGRIDYGMHRGEPQVWEINMNPTMGRPASRMSIAHQEPNRVLREPGRALAHLRMLEAFRAIDTRVRPRTLPVALRPELRSQLEAERARAEQPEATSAASRIDRHPRLKRLVRNAVFTAAAGMAPALANAVRLRHQHRRLKPGPSSNGL